jgi:hypothetical protein
MRATVAPALDPSRWVEAAYSSKIRRQLGAGSNWIKERLMKIAVHRFQVWDSVSDTMKTSSRYATVDAIKETAHGVPVPGTEILIDASELNSDVEGMTAKSYKTPTP